MIAGEEVWSHPKAKAIYDDYLIRVRDLESRGELVDPNSIWFDLNNGFVKGQVFGLGTAAPLFYDKAPSTSIRGKSSSKTYVPRVLTQVMEAREREAEEFRKFREEAAQKEEIFFKNQEEIKQNQLKSDEANLRKQEELERRIESLTKLFESQTQYRCNSNILNIPQNPNDDNSGEGGIDGAGVGYEVVN